MRKTAVLSQQGRVWQSADCLSRTLIINPSRSELPRKPTFISLNSKNENTNFESSIIFVVPISQRTRKPNAKRKLAFGFAEVQLFFETQSQRPHRKSHLAVFLTLPHLEGFRMQSYKELLVPTTHGGTTRGYYGQSEK